MSRTLFFGLLCCSAHAAEPSVAERLADWERRVAEAVERPASAESLRNEIGKFLTTPQASASATRCVALLARLPPVGATPAAPAFPFATAVARAYQRDYARWRGWPVEFVGEHGLTFVLVPSGRFVQGSPRDEPGHGAGGYDEAQHEVTLTRPFYLARHEVTVGQFRAFVSATNYVTDGERNGGGNAHDGRAVWAHRPGTHWRKPGFAGPYEQRDDHAVVHVSHADAQKFCEWLTKSAGREARFDLPTEAQWEWACRAGTETRYWWGAEEDTTGRVANVGDRRLKATQPEWPRTVMAMDDGHAFVAPVGRYEANPFGLCDMLGNVWEFCATRYGPAPAGPVTDPGDADPRRGFAVRGGGWSNVAADVRSASRNADPPHFCHSNLGFRVKLEFAK